VELGREPDPARPVAVEIAIPFFFHHAPQACDLARPGGLPDLFQHRVFEDVAQLEHVAHLGMRGLAMKAPRLASRSTMPSEARRESTLRTVWRAVS
jgi:hypothetical protein